jgi:hypothetical protein
MVILNNHNKRRKKSMKKIFTILAVLGALTFIAVPAQALIGMPDDQPGNEFNWWFLADTSGGLNTILVAYEISGFSAGFHYTIYNKKSETLNNYDTTLTEYDMDSFNGYDLANLVTAGDDRDSLLITLDGVEYYFGYVKFVNTSSSRGPNRILAKTFILDIQNGMYSESNVPVNEMNSSSAMGATGWMVDGRYLEMFSANALSNAQRNQGNVANGFTNATSLTLYPRYFKASSSGKSYLIVWKSTNSPTDSIHADWYDNDENHASGNIRIPYELNIVDMAAITPPGLYDDDAPFKEGWFNFQITPFNRFRQVTAWTWTKDQGSAAESWTSLAPVARTALPYRD